MKCPRTMLTGVIPAQPCLNAQAPQDEQCRQIRLAHESPRKA